MGCFVARQDMLKIALVGVPGCGKSELAAALAHALNTLGRPATVVPIQKPALVPDLVSHDLVLLAGLDMPSSAQPAQQALDRQIRAALADAGMAYRVIYGLGEERLRQALQACGGLLMAGPTQSQGHIIASKKAKPWAWMCEKCSDPACEHRLLSDLLARRSPGG